MALVVDLGQGSRQQGQFDLFPKVVDLLDFLNADRFGVISTMAFMADQALKFKPLQGLDHGCLAHAQPFGQIPVGDFLPRYDLIVK
jgi:hypothetical protein